MLKQSKGGLYTHYRHSCERCLFFCTGWNDEGRPNKIEEIDCGECRRYPPIFTVVTDDSSIDNFPLVTKYEWCGEYKGE